MGRRLGFPTANIYIGNAVKEGVYAARALGRDAMANVKDGLLEVHIFDFEGDLYGQELDVELTKFIRPERTFATTEELRRAIENDKRTIYESCGHGSGVVGAQGD